uniref:Phosphodiesterase n=1 Tax=Neospora caninum (strain Liverpool) TaxID=572307 RepID=A0A0F7UMM4_NEOCL|nr:TPA: calcium/calmodulin-dependent 3', 5'-cyclic nucleotide phosphodiesterase, putative [Neospora caninum Liverpool]
MGLPERMRGEIPGEDGKKFVPFHSSLAEQMNAADPSRLEDAAGDGDLSRHALAVHIEHGDDRAEPASQPPALEPWRSAEMRAKSAPERDRNWTSLVSLKRSGPQRWKSWKREGEDSDIDDVSGSCTPSDGPAPAVATKSSRKFFFTRKSLVGRVKRRKSGGRRAARWVRQTSSRARSFVAEKAVATFGVELDLYTGRQEKAKELRRTSKTSLAFSSMSGARGVTSVGSSSHPFSLIPLKFRDEQLESEYVTTLNALCASRIYTCFGVFMLVLVVLWPSMATSFSLSLHQAAGIGCRLFHLLWIAKLISWAFLLIVVALRNRVEWFKTNIIPFATMQITWGFVLVIAFCCAYVANFIYLHNDKINQINHVYEKFLVRGPRNRRMLVASGKLLGAGGPVDLGLFTLAEDFVASLSLLMLLAMVESLVAVVCLGSLIPTRTRYTWPLYLIAPFLCPIPCVICNAVAPSFILGSTTVVYYFVSITVWLTGFIVRYSSECSQRVAFYSRVAPRKEIENLKNSLRRSQRQGGCTAVEELQHTAKCMEAVVKQLEGTCMTGGRDFAAPSDAEGRASVQELSLLLTKLQEVLQGTDDLYSVRHTPFMLESATGQELLELYGTNLSRQPTLTWTIGCASVDSSSQPVPFSSLTSLEGPSSRFYQSKNVKRFVPSLPSAFGVLPGLASIHEPPLRQNTDPVHHPSSSLLSPTLRLQYHRHTSDRVGKRACERQLQGLRGCVGLRGPASSSSLRCGHAPSIAEASREEEAGVEELKRRDETGAKHGASSTEQPAGRLTRTEATGKHVVASLAVVVSAGPDKVSVSAPDRRAGEPPREAVHVEPALSERFQRVGKEGARDASLRDCFRGDGAVPHRGGANEGRACCACVCHAKADGEAPRPCVSHHAAGVGLGEAATHRPGEGQGAVSPDCFSVLSRVSRDSDPEEPSLSVSDAEPDLGEKRRTKGQPSPVSGVSGRRRKIESSPLGLKCFRRSRQRSAHLAPSSASCSPSSVAARQCTVRDAASGQLFVPSPMDTRVSDSAEFDSRSFVASPVGSDAPPFQSAANSSHWYAPGRASRWGLKRSVKSHGKTKFFARLRGKGSKELGASKRRGSEARALKACSLRPGESETPARSRGSPSAVSSGLGCLGKREGDAGEGHQGERTLDGRACDDVQRRGSASNSSLGEHAVEPQDLQLGADPAFEEPDLLGLKRDPLTDACIGGSPFSRSAFLPSSDAHTAIGQVWDFDMLSFAAMTPNPLVEVGLVLFLPEIDALHCCTDQEAIVLLQNLQARYLNNPYHNQVHAAEVTHAAACLIRCLIPQRSAFANLCTLIAAAAHDLGHPARTNLFLQNLLHPLSIMYNDVSILENFHSALLFRIFSDIPCSNVFAKLPQEMFRVARQNIITLILATDIKQHFETISRFRLRRNSPEFNFLKKEEDDWLVRKMIFKMADISHSSVAWDTHFFWSCKVTAEFYAQGDAEVRLGLPVSPLCDREKHCEMGKGQVAFLNFVVEPLLRELEAIEALVLPLGTCPIISVELLSNFAENVRQWKAVDTEKKVVILERAITDYGVFGVMPSLTEAQRRQLIVECCQPLEDRQESVG